MSPWYADVHRHMHEESSKVPPLEQETDGHVVVGGAVVGGAVVGGAVVGAVVAGGTVAGTVAVAVDESGANVVGSVCHKEHQVKLD